MATTNKVLLGYVPYPAACGRAGTINEPRIYRGRLHQVLSDNWSSTPPPARTV
jgi:hypothetical protein